MTNLDPLDLNPQQEARTPHSSMDLHGVVRLLLDKGWLILTCVVLCVVAAALYVKHATRIYEAVSTVQVEQQDAKIMDAEAVVHADAQSQDVLNTIVQKLCNPVLLEQVLITNHLLPAQGYAVTNGSNIVSREEIITEFSKNVKTTLRRNTRLIDIAVRNTSPALAADLANSLVDSYLGQDASMQRATTIGASGFLKLEADKARATLEMSETNLQNYRRTNGTISLQENQNIVTPQLQNISARLTQSKAAFVQAEGAYNDAMKMSTNIEALMAYSQISTDPDVVQTSSEVQRAEDSFVLIRLRYKEKHPKYIQAAESVKALKAQLATTVLRARARTQEGLRIAYENAKTAKEGLELEEKSAESNAMQLSDAAVQYNVLVRQVEANKLQYDALYKRLGETSVAEKITPERIKLVQPALIPELPASPKIKAIFALAIFGGFALGFGLSFMLSAMNTSFRTVDEVEQYLALPVLGTVPKLPKEGAKLVASGDSNSSGAEVFRTLRATVSMLGKEKDRRTYLFTSSLPGEGKTFTALNFSASLAQQGLRVLLIDMDLRRPMVENFFTDKRHILPGVTDYLLGRKKLEEVCIQHGEIAKFSWMPSGTSVPNPSELLSQVDFTQLLKDCLAHYDRVIIDTAPVLPVSDTLLLADRVQTVMLVVHGYKTSRKGVERAVQLLKRAGAPLSGVVLNLLPHRRLGGAYYYSYYHGYGYGHYGSKEEKKTSEKGAEKTSVKA